MWVVLTVVCMQTGPYLDYHCVSPTYCKLINVKIFFFFVVGLNLPSGVDLRVLSTIALESNTKKIALWLLR